MHKTSALLLTTLAMAGLTACGGDSGGGSGGVSDALDAVSANAASAQSFAYTDLAALRDVTELPRPGGKLDRDFLRWNVPATLGAPQLTQRMFSIRSSDGQGVDLFSADRLTTIGDGGDSATRIDGFDGETEPLTGLADSSTAKDGTVVVAREAKARDAALGQGGDRLGDQPAFAAAADCLGDVLAAQISPAKQAGVPADAGEFLAVGVRGGDEPADVLCIVGDEAQAKRADAALRHALASGASGADQRLVASFASIDFATGDTRDRHWVRVLAAAKADGQLGVLYRAVYQMLLPRQWFGADGG